ncbi:MAG: hypothetical protein KBE04_04820 [Phycisphaerae bacterium]|nr:hypothetical protein [Phycisphaerae bacterium]
MSTGHRILMAIAVCVLIMVVNPGTNTAAGGEPPVAEAGLPRYAATDPATLDGTGSYDPDNSGPLSYSWRQTSGPPLVITGADTATPTISGFVQTAGIQECVFELVVGDGELTSRADTTKVVVVPTFGDSTLRLENASFDPNKPTLIYFGGGMSCGVGYPDQYVDSPDWISRTNVVGFPYGYERDTGVVARTFYHYGDMMIVYLSSVAPCYTQAIQICGWSAGGQPATDVALRLNLTYKDTRYAVNRVSLLDSGPACRDYSESIRNLLASSVDGEQCWIDIYIGERAASFPNILNVALSLPHRDVPTWYFNSLLGSDMNQFRHGAVAGAYWSVVGPGKNLQLASTPNTITYFDKWNGDTSSGHMEFYDESSYPGRLPEPVTLIGPSDGNAVGAGGAVLSCRDSENAVRYQLLLGRDPFHMIYLVADTATPPDGLVTVFPFQKTWWTIKVHDSYGSTIDADPICVSAENVAPQIVENADTGQTYASIQQAVDDAHGGDEIVLGAGVWKYLENLNLKGKSVTLRSSDPNDPSVVGATVICGDGRGPVVTLSSGEGRPSVLDGLTIAGGTVGVSCRDAAPTIRCCTIGSKGPVAVEFWHGHEPTLVDCTLFGQVMEGGDPSPIAR